MARQRGQISVTMKTEDVPDKLPKDKALGILRNNHFPMDDADRDHRLITGHAGDNKGEAARSWRSCVLRTTTAARNLHPAYADLLTQGFRF